MQASKIYELLVKMNKGKPDQPDAYLDRDTNTVWILIGEGRMLTFWCPVCHFEEMSDAEIHNFINDILE